MGSTPLPTTCIHVYGQHFSPHHPGYRYTPAQDTLPLSSAEPHKMPAYVGVRAAGDSVCCSRAGLKGSEHSVCALPVIPAGNRKLNLLFRTADRTAGGSSGAERARPAGAPGQLGAPSSCLVCLSGSDGPDYMLCINGVFLCHTQTTLFKRKVARP